MDEADLRRQAWDFFRLQAGQRLTTFNFYIALSSLLSTGLAASMKVDFRAPYVGPLLGVLLMFFSFIFWKLDCRNCHLMKGAEETLKFFEQQVPLKDFGDVPHVAKRFCRENHETSEKLESNRWWRQRSNLYTYSQCFQWVFIVFGGVGLAGAVYSAVLAATQG